MHPHPNTIKISALAITLNEEEHVERYVQSLSFADEIIFVDSYSTDNTVEIAKRLGVTVIQRDFDNFSNQRNFAIEQAKNDWVIFFDLDEIISNELGTEIIQTVEQPGFEVAFYVKRNFIFFNKKLNYGGFQNDKAIRLFNKKNCIYNGNLVHEEITTEGAIGILKNSADHYSFKNLDHYCSKLNHYSELQALKLYHQQLHPNLYHFLIRPSYRFVWQYLFRLGFLDGKEGFISAQINSFFVFKRYLNLWMLNKNQYFFEIVKQPI